jgi:alpha-beta hydrolase superfamily lysophospholipase
MRIFGILLLGATLAFHGCGRAVDKSAAETLTIDTADGLRLAASWYPSNRPNPPGLVLVHMLGSNRQSWEPFAVRAQQAGYACIAMDLRGHGDSAQQASGRMTYRGFKREDWLAALQDIDAAKRVLLERGADLDNLAIAGASIGANLALHYALAHPDIQSVVMLSPGLDYHGVTTESEIALAAKIPVLLMTAKGDAYSATTCGALKQSAGGLCELREYDGSAHGTDLFATSSQSMDQILLWLKPILH